MTNPQPITLVSQLKKLGFTKGNRMRLYGKEFEMVSDPIVESDDKVLVEAVEKKKPGETKRLPIPLPVLKMKQNRAA